MPHHRIWMIVPAAALVGCQLLIGLDEGKLGDPGTGGGASSSTSAGSGNQGGASSSTASTASAASTSTTGASSGAGGGLMVDLIDDMEDGDGQILQTMGRIGSWFSYNDGTGTQTPLPGGQCVPEMVMG